MFQNSSFWIPPLVNKYTQGLSDESFKKAQQSIETELKINE
jgi:hypothetical protein